LLPPVAALVAVLLLLPPIAQDPAYHDFADRRGLLGIPNISQYRRPTSRSSPWVSLASLLCADTQKP
jgi:hypothetical protein